LCTSWRSTKSFQAGHAGARAAHTFVDRLQPNDLVGLIVFPEGPLLQVTTDRVRLFEEVVVGLYDPIGSEPLGTDTVRNDLTYLYAKNDLVDTEGSRICAGLDRRRAGVPPGFRVVLTPLRKRNSTKWRSLSACVRAMFVLAAAPAQGRRAHRAASW
jgi:hypothetical protein